MRDKCGKLSVKTTVCEKEDFSVLVLIYFYLVDIIVFYIYMSSLKFVRFKQQMCQKCEDREINSQGMCNLNVL